ncbi:MAG: M14 family zinc carboxypeptidase, partial [Planctomycetota bacterium]
MIPLLPFLPLVLITAGCASPSTPTELPPHLTSPGSLVEVMQQEPGGSFQPIRFGDKEGYQWSESFFPGTTYDPAIRNPDAILGQALGTRLARHSEILEAFRTWGKQSDRIALFEYGRTYEGRPLVYAVITSPGNHAQLEEIRRHNHSLADPRGLSKEDGDSLLTEMPAVAWMGYSIHGDETSGTDASMAIAYHLIAGQGEVEELLEDVVVILDPCLNPDGRMRIVPMTEQLAGFRTNLDPASMSRGHWPYGRGNHYLFDMNRDWMVGVAPETRGRWAVNRMWRPQLFVDAHEQGGSDTFLMYPQAQPRHPAMPDNLLKWQGIFADDHGSLFDAYGWGYYTREWADGWFPGYSDSWGSLNGAIGMLYEQGRYAGQPYRRPSGEVVPYRRAVHAQALASWSNLKTLARNRIAILEDYLAHRRSQVDGSRADAARSFLFQAKESDMRTTAFVDTLLSQGIEVWRATEPFTATNSVHALGDRQSSQDFPAGTWVVPVNQPQGALVRAYLEFDPRMPEDLLVEERESLELGKGSKLYDITAWDLGRAFDLDSWWAEVGESELEPVESVHVTQGKAIKMFEEPAYAWAIDSSDDRILRFSSRAMELGLQLHLADEPFTGRSKATSKVFPRGSILIRHHENQGLELDALVTQVAEQTGVQAIALTTGRSPDLEQADLGGRHLDLLQRPHVALLAGPSVGTSGFG